MAIREVVKAKQAAYEEIGRIRSEMAELYPAMTELYGEVGALQAHYDLLKADADAEWDAYKQILGEYDLRIGGLISAVTEAKSLKEKFEYLALDEQGAKARLYTEAASFFEEAAGKLSDEKAAVLEEKKAERKPDNATRDAVLRELKSKRAEHKAITAKYRSLKEALAKQQLLMKQAKERYEELRDDAFSFESMEREREEEARRKEILTTARIPEEFWEGAAIRENGDLIDIYYGGDSAHTHGHVSLLNDNVTFSREPRESTKL